VQSSGSGRKSLSRRILESPPALLLGVLAAVIALSQAWHDSLHEPDVNLVGSPTGAQVFEYPFAVKNNSVLFAMRDTHIFCGIVALLSSTGGGIRNLSVTSNGTATINPDETVNYGCSVATAGSALATGHIRIWMKYKTLFFPRTFEGTKFTWYTKGPVPQWIKGTVVGDEW
jgi:hypothetical protein